MKTRRHWLNIYEQSSKGRVAALETSLYSRKQARGRVLWRDSHMDGQTTPTVGDHMGGLSIALQHGPSGDTPHRSRLLVVALAPTTLASIYIEQLHQFRQEITYVCGVGSGRHL
jgi:hypothetical protein